MSCSIQPIPHAALLVVDLQNDFMPGGQLAVANGHEIVQPINKMMSAFGHVVCSQDDHPWNHKSFHEFNGQWPAHCIRGTFGQQLHRDLIVDRVAFTALKGTDPDHDSYSAFFAGGKDLQGLPRSTGLMEFLRGRDIVKVVITGVATDFCVKASALDAIKSGFQTYVCRTATAAAVDQEGALKEMASQGVKILDSWDEASAQVVRQ